MDDLYRTAFSPVQGNSSEEREKSDEARRLDENLFTPLSLDNDRVAFTGFIDQAATEKAECQVTLSELADLIGKTNAPDKGQLPWLILGRFGNLATKKGCLRHVGNLLGVTGIDSDYDGKFDGGKTSFEDAVIRLHQAGIEALLYTSPSHTEAAPRWRVLCPFSREYLPANRDCFLDRLNGVLGGVLEPESWTLSRAYYFGTVGGKLPVRVEVVSGTRIDRRDDLDAGAIGKGGACKTTRTERRAAPDGLIESDDDPRLITEARRWIARVIDDRGGRPYAVEEGTGTYPVAAKLADLRTKDGRILSHSAIVDLLIERWGLDFDRDWTQRLVDHVFEYRENDRGCELVLTSAETFIGALGTTGEAKQGSGRFRIIWPEEYANLPDLDFWDDDEMLPRSPDGAVTVLFGDYGSHKTNLTLTLALDAIKRGARVCYAAGEGAHGVGKQRIPAHCVARGIQLSDLRGKLAPVPAIPLLALASDVDEFIEALRDLRPNIIVLDTLATAAAGQDENSSLMSAFLTANGPVGRIRDAFKALVIVVAHQGKDPSRGVRGHSGILGNADVGLRATVDKDSGAIEVFVEKMRDGRDRFSIYFQVEPGLNGVPVPRKISDADYRALVGSAKKEDRPERLNKAFAILTERQAYGFKNGIREPDIAVLSVARPVGGVEPREPTQYRANHQTAIQIERQAWKDARRKPAYEMLWSKQVPIGGRKPEVRWHLPEPSANA